MADKFFPDEKFVARGKEANFVLLSVTEAIGKTLTDLGSGQENVVFDTIFGNSVQANVFSHHNLPLLCHSTGWLQQW
jgi:hypothetical protein